MRSSDDLNWEIIKALMNQVDMVMAHIQRIREKRDRYDQNIILWSFTNAELQMWEQIKLILDANLEGKTVAPS
jgi:hypothetical protein